MKTMRQAEGIDAVAKRKKTNIEYMKRCHKAESIDKSAKRKITDREWSDPKTLFVFVIHLNLAKPVTNTLKSR